MCVPYAVRSVDMDISARNGKIREQLLAGGEESAEIEMQQNTISSSDRFAKHLRADQIRNLERLENDPAIVQEHKRLFIEEISKRLAGSKRESGLIRESRYLELINACTRWRDLSTEERKTVGYRILKNYYILKVGDREELFWSRKDPSDPHKQVLHSGNMFEAIKKEHDKAGHVKARTLMQKMRHLYGKSVPEWAIKAFTDRCAHCVELSLMAKNPPAGHKPIISEVYGQRGQADLIDYQSMCYNGLKFLLVYQDHFSKFVDCRPLPDKRKRTVARALLEILTLLGAPRILHTDNGTEFDGLALDVPLADWNIDEVIDEIALLWPECMMVKGAPRHSPSQGSVERANRKFRRQIRSWLHSNRENECKNDWPTASMFARYNINTAYHHGIRNLPYKLVFGQNPICGIRGLPLLSEDLASTLHTEEDLAKFYTNNQNARLDQEILNPRTPNRRQWRNTANVQYTAGRISNMQSEEDIESQLAPAPVSRGDESTYGEVIDLADTVSPMGNSATQDGDEPVENQVAPIRFCNRCKKRIYGPGELISSTHMNCGGEEAMCKCIRGRSSTLEIGRLDQKEPSANDFQSSRRSAVDLDVLGSTSRPSNEPYLIGVSQLKYALLQADIEYHRDNNESEKQDQNEKVSTHSREASLDNTNNTDIRLINLDVSPRRERERQKAVNSLRAQAKKMQARAMSSQGLQSDLDIGQICRLGIPPPDRKNSDASTITTVVVQKRHDGMYKLACKHGVLKNLHFRSYLEPLPDVTMELMGLQDVYKNWRSRPEISIAQAAKAKAVAINARLRCNCQSDCSTLRCKCRKAGLLCKSSCHRGNTKCCNKDSS